MSSKIRPATNASISLSVVEVAPQVFVFDLTYCFGVFLAHPVESCSGHDDVGHMRVPVDAEEIAHFRRHVNFTAGSAHGVISRH